MMHQLEKFTESDQELNSALVSDLVDLQAVEAAPLIEQVFEADAVDEMFAGTWPAVQVELGLKPKAAFSPEQLRPKLPFELVEIRKNLKILANKTHKSKGFGTTVQTKKKKKK
jgi:hypothetical protein